MFVEPILTVSNPVLLSQVGAFWQDLQSVVQMDMGQSQEIATSSNSYDGKKPIFSSLSSWCLNFLHLFSTNSDVKIHAGSGSLQTVHMKMEL